MGKVCILTKLMNFIHETIYVPIDNEVLMIRVTDIDGEVDSFFNGYAFKSSDEGNTVIGDFNGWQNEGVNEMVDTQQSDDENSTDGGDKESSGEFDAVFSENMVHDTNDVNVTASFPFKNTTNGFRSPIPDIVGCSEDGSTSTFAEVKDKDSNIVSDKAPDNNLGCIRTGSTLKGIFPSFCLLRRSPQPQVEAHPSPSMSPRPNKSTSLTTYTTKSIPSIIPETQLLNQQAQLTQEVKHVLHTVGGQNLSLHLLQTPLDPPLGKKRFSSLRLFNPLYVTSTQPRKRKSKIAKVNTKTISQPTVANHTSLSNDLEVSDSLLGILRCNTRILSQPTASNNSESNEVNNTINVGNLVGFAMNGIGEDHKRSWVKRLCIENKVKFVRLQETMSRDDNKFLIQSLWKNSKFAYFTKTADGKSGGIIAIWDPSFFSSSSAIEGDGFVAITDIQCIESAATVKLRGKLDDLDNKAEVGPLTPTDATARIDIVRELTSLERIKVMDLRQKAKVRWAVDGDENSHFFHGMLNSKLNHSRINGLNILGSWITNPVLIKNHIYQFYESKFKETSNRRPTFTSNLFNRISVEDSNLLDRTITPQEIKDAIWDCGGDKAPGPDGDVTLPLSPLSPKIDDPLTIGEFRPISLIGCQYKIIAKILANRLSLVIPSVIGEVQMAYIKGRQIIDGPLIVDEIISWAKKYKKRLMFLKVDLEKAFDTLNWSFLFSIMEQMGFRRKWRTWISSCLKSAFASVLINGSPTKEFKVEKGLRQGDPLSPFLFIIAIEALNVALLNACNNTFHGVKVGKDNIHVSQLQFADDALIMGEWSWLNAMNLSRILTCFNLASGLKINFHKSKLYGVGVTTLEVNSLASMIGCLPSNFPCTYLGLPIGGNMSRCANWGILVDKFNKRLSNWKAMSLSFGGRFTLIKSVLGSLGVYYFSTFKAPNKIINKLEGIRRKKIWGGTTDENKIAWIAWDKATSSISNGGLGIGTLKSSNQAMLSKWWWRFHTENHAFWCMIIRFIQGVDGGLNDTSLIKSKSGPWYRIAKLKDDLSKIGIDLPSIFKKKIGDGCSTRFWLDTWLGGSPLKDTFPRLFWLDSNPSYLVCNRCPTFQPLTHMSSAATS
ncbi:putative RNA-directed DNA polymerase [Tanacetum coccineum]